MFWGSTQPLLMTKLKTMIVILSVVSLLAFATKASIAEQSTYTPQEMTAEEIVREALGIAASICVYTNDNISIEKL